MSRIKVRHIWKINPLTRVVPKKKRKKRINKKVEDRYIILDALEEINEEKQTNSNTEIRTD